MQENTTGFIKDIEVSMEDIWHMLVDITNIIEDMHIITEDGEDADTIMHIEDITNTTEDIERMLIDI